jgi:hypothetical protein
MGTGIVAASQQNRYPRGRTYSYKHTDGSGYVHQRECYGKTGNRFRPYNLTYKNTVYDIVEGHDEHTDHSGQAVIPQ